MKITKYTELNNKQKERILELWNNEYPEKLAYNSVSDFENYLNKLTEQNHYFLLDKSEEINGWATTFIRENEKWFAIIVSEKLHGKGFGTKILNELKNNENTLNGWVIDHDSDKKLNGNFYQSPLKFYLKNEFEMLSETRLELEIMSAVKIKWTK
ncbi:GNAT family N-acetyltransferase [Pseudopedobacter beijingensis]|uniref:GNAT family N-acetyltransferase n=1 Tax=Pseudopedobacter beijingensis TaxID=1207056 RepID=A0ABW4IC56_9SPHI